MSESTPTPRREATRSRLIDAAVREFAAHGIDATSVEQLCEAAGFSRGAFYSNFATKDDLCLAMLAQYRDHVIDVLGEAFSAPPADADLAWATGSALQGFFERITPSDEFQLAMTEIRLRSTRNPELAAGLQALSAQVLPPMESFIEQLGAKLNLSFRMPVGLMVQVFEAIFVSDLLNGTDDGFQGLIGPLAAALSDPKVPDGQ